MALLLAEGLDVCGPAWCHLAGISPLPACTTPSDLESQGPSSLHSRTLPDLEMNPSGPLHLSTRCLLPTISVYECERDRKAERVEFI